MPITAFLVRLPFIFLLALIGVCAPMHDRVYYMMQGLEGHILEHDNEVIIRRKLRPLNRFEKWLFGPIVASEHKRKG